MKLVSFFKHTHTHTHKLCERETYFGYGRCNPIPRKPFTHIKRDASTVQNRFWMGIEPHVECSHSIESWSHQFSSPTHVSSMYWVTLAKWMESCVMSKLYAGQLQALSNSKYTFGSWVRSWIISSGYQLWNMKMKIDAVSKSELKCKSYKRPESRSIPSL